MSQTKFIERIKNTYFKFNKFFENRALYEVMRKNNVEPDMPQKTLSSRRFVRLISKVTNIGSDYVILFARPLQ
jgi:hypothetical protein